ncbi:hypothetical protein ACFX1X_021971 [Malus domestica]
MATTRSSAAAAALGASSSGTAGEKDTNGAAPFPGLETKQEQTDQ